MPQPTDFRPLGEPGSPGENQDIPRKLEQQSANPSSRPGARSSKPVSPGVPFQDADSVRHLSHAAASVSPTLAAALPDLLTEAPDPDSAIILLDRLVSESPLEVKHLLERHPFLAHYAIVVFGNSRFLGETLIQNTDLLHSFLRERILEHSFSHEELHETFARFRSRSFEADLPLLLARFKRREYVRILLRDVLRIAPLAETTAEISALADVLIEETLRESESRLQRRYESPRHLDSGGRLVETPFSILALGKLGGNELNYCSDIDLMYIFGDGEAPADAHQSNREYFVRLAQQVTEVLSQVTREGPVFRIDMRLRPQGAEGELAVSLSHALKYYASSAHDWERQALIKVRFAAGDPGLAREFIRGVQPYVYTSKVNFAAVETAVKTRSRIQERRKRHVHSPESAEVIDVKLDRGGIRDIEFLVQCLQRVYGGTESWLRSGGTLFSLQKLHDKRHITGAEFHELTNTYEYFRHLEHRLQLREGQQTHRLSTHNKDLRILQRAMQPFSGGHHGADNIRHFACERMTAVADIYDRIIHRQRVRSQEEVDDSGFELLHSRLEPVVERSNQQVLQRLAVDSPVLYKTISQDLSPHARKNLFRFLAAALTSSERYAVLMRYSEAIGRALGLFETSDYLTDILIRYPEELATLAEVGEVNVRVGSGYLFESPLGHGGTLGDPVFAYIANSQTSYGERLSLLRQHYRHRIFASGARDITESRNVYTSLAVATAAAEDAISAAFGIADEPDELAVMALGRLGSGEFDMLSDADLLFLCADNGDRTILTRAAEQMIHALAAYTHDGMVFPVDPRLRPRGAEGELLVSPAQLAAYFVREAQPWEALTYTKLRYLAGSRDVADRAFASLEQLYGRFAADPEFLSATHVMRVKLQTTGERNFKTSPGGIYDIDFLSSFLLVKHGMPEKHGTLRDRLWRCVGHGILDKAEAAILDHGVELLRTVEHAVRLVLGRANKWLPGTEHAREMTEKITARMVQREFPGGLETELVHTCADVHDVYAHHLQ